MTPTAFSRPISRVRSLTETIITFMIPMPATESEMAAIPARAAVSRARMRLNEVRTASCVTTVTSSYAVVALLEQRDGARLARFDLLVRAQLHHDLG